MQNVEPAHKDQSRFNARKLKRIQGRRRQTHDIFVTACIVLFPTVVVFGIVYLAVLCHYYINTRNIRLFVNSLASSVAYEAKIRTDDLYGTPVLFGTTLTLFYLTIFFFNCDVPGVKPSFPRLGFFTVHADSNYGFAVLLGVLSTALCAMPDVLFVHASRIYA